MSWFELSDYRIQSKKVLVAVNVVCTFTAAILLICDYIIDLKAGSFEVFLAFFIANVLILFISLKESHSKKIEFAIPLLIFCLLEYLFLAKPTIFNVVIYWFPFVPVLAVIVQGLRASYIWIGVISLTQLYNYYHIKTVLGSETYNLVVSTEAFFISGLIFLSATIATIYLLYNLLGRAYSKTIEKNEELEKLKNKTEQKSLRLTAFNAALIELNRNPEVYQTTNKLFVNVCALVQDSLEVDRVSIWLFNSNHDSLELKYLLQNGVDATEELTINQSDFPSYFKAVINNPYIMANDAKSHSDTIEFKDSYLKPLGIKSMLDCPILLDQKAIGVVCCEHVGETRNWEAEDALITQSLADFVASNFKNEHIRTLLSALKEQNHELSLSSSKIESMNQELHQLNQKLVESNGTLEEAVDKRTEELLIQNNQLKEYAFVNSHMLRAPLSSILGISNLLQIHNTSIEDHELLTALHKSTKNLDEIVKKISSTLEDGSNLTRKDIDFIINKQFEKSKSE